MSPKRPANDINVAHIRARIGDNRWKTFRLTISPTRDGEELTYVHLFHKRGRRMEANIQLRDDQLIALTNTLVDVVESRPQPTE